MKYSRDFKITSGLLVVALGVGGAGLSFPFLQMLLGLCATGAAGYFAWSIQPRLSSYARIALALIAGALALIVLQLAPLPPFVWHALPGREVPEQLDNVLGQTVWRPWTLDVEATIRSLLVLIPAVVVFIGCLRMPSVDRAKLLWVIVGFALFSAILGIAQLASGGRLTPYPSAHQGYPIGLFVNRNHNAVLLLVSIPMAAALGAVQLARGRLSASTIAATLSAIAVLAIVVIATTSRMALVLLPIALAASMALLFLGQSTWRAVLPSTIALAAVAVVILVGGGFNRNLMRFSSLQDSRFDYWTDVKWALGHYGLAGTGFGTFIPVYKSAESLGVVGQSVLNHAHNDYIEILLEGGLPAVLLLVLFFVFIGVCGFKLARMKVNPDRGLMSVAAAAGIFLLLVFSLVDYPLRMPALSCVFAVLCALILPRTHAPTQRKLVAVAGEGGVRAARSRTRSAVGRVAALLGVAVAGILIVQAGLSSHDLLAGQDREALHWAPWSTDARERAANGALLQGNPADAVKTAYSALALSPISAPAIRTIGLAEMERGAPDAGNRLMDLAAALGWRDVITQVWAIDAAKRSGEPEKGRGRAEALFQQHLFQPGLFAVLQPPNASLTSSVVEDLEKQPEWRSGFLKSGADLSPPLLDGFVALVVQLGTTTAPPTTEEARTLFDRLISLDQVENARRLWNSVHGGQLVLNGNFERVDRGRGAELPADWSISSEDLSALDVGKPEPGAQSRALRIYNPRGSAPIISQRMMLSPGSYMLSFRAREGSSSGSVLRWEIRCLESRANIDGDVIPAATRSWQQLAVNLTVPNQDCLVQRLALKRLADMHPQELWIDDVQMKAIAR
jgi:O-antigen ligase